jgi:hypothetical protein
MALYWVENNLILFDVFTRFYNQPRWGSILQKKGTDILARATQAYE